MHRSRRRIGYRTVVLRHCLVIPCFSFYRDIGDDGGATPHAIYRPVIAASSKTAWLTCVRLCEVKTTWILPSRVWMA